SDGTRQRHIAHGVCRSGEGDLAPRLKRLFGELQAVIAEYQPNAAAVESTFVNKDAVGTLKLGQARGVVLLAASLAELEVGEYAPNAVKKAVVGVGHADKRQIQHMIRLQFPGIELSGPDAADALAIGLCHLWHLQSGQRLAKAVMRAKG
ncbi:MAG: crossover junction endodeoxyribonuclease RuvC, partial [Mangrovicoccus sp.]